MKHWTREASSSPAVPARVRGVALGSPVNEAEPWGLMPELVGRLIGDDPARRAEVKTRFVQLLILINVALGTRYIAWRMTCSVNWALWPFGLALLGAELFSWTDSLLFGMNMWRVRHRGDPPLAPRDLSVDVFVTTYNEPVELVKRTALAARDIRYPHTTWILDDGDRPGMRQAAEEIGVGYLVRDGRWNGRDRHAKAGNVINGLYRTKGEFVLMLDADQVPRPGILDRTLGYFRDPSVAFVQTPQFFDNTPDGDPFGTDAPLFYGPIQAGKDGWNSTFFCGSNAVLRREALMRAGVVWYARDLERRIRRSLRRGVPALRRARVRLRQEKADPRLVRALDDVLVAARAARRALAGGGALQDVTWRFQRDVEAASRRIVEDDLGQISTELATLPGVAAPLTTEASQLALRRMSCRDLSPLGAVDEVRALLRRVDLDFDEEAEAVRPMATLSVTEDMATAMRLHGLGYRSVYHHEVLAVGLAPEDLHSALQQRLRWAQGTLQVMFRENPLLQRGLSLPQRLLYFGTMWSYLSGFASVIYIFSPVLFLAFGLMPVKAWSAEFFAYLVPWLVVNQLLFVTIGWRLSTLRGQQYSLALFPLWLKATWTAFGNVYFKRPLGFVVTPKTRQEGPQLRLVWPQIAAMVALILAVAIGFGRLALGWTQDAGPIVINTFWATYNLVMLSVALVAVSYRPPEAGR